METILRQNLMETILLVKVICTKGYAQSDGTIGWKISMYKFMEKGARLDKFVVLKNVGREARYV